MPFQKRENPRREDNFQQSFTHALLSKKYYLFPEKRSYNVQIKKKLLNNIARHSPVYHQKGGDGMFDWTWLLNLIIAVLQTVVQHLPYA